MGELSHHILALNVEVATLRIEIDRFRAELHLIVEQFLDNNGWHGTGTARPAIGRQPPPAVRLRRVHGKHVPTGPEHDEDASDKRRLSR